MAQATDLHKDADMEDQAHHDDIDETLEQSGVYCNDHDSVTDSDFDCIDTPDGSTALGNRQDPSGPRHQDDPNKAHVLDAEVARDDDNVRSNEKTQEEAGKNVGLNSRRATSEIDTSDSVKVSKKDKIKSSRVSLGTQTPAPEERRDKDRRPSSQLKSTEIQTEPEEEEKPFAVDFKTLPGPPVVRLDVDQLMEEHEEIVMKCDSELEALRQEWQQLNGEIAVWLQRGVEMQHQRELCRLSEHAEIVSAKEKEAIRRRDELVKFCTQLQTAFSAFFPDSA